jgi:alpha-1,3-rhamnosyl/mannosyltransferase
MRIAIDTRALRPPLAGIGHYVHRLTKAMLPLLSPGDELLSFNGLIIEPLDHPFLDLVETRNSNYASGPTSLSSAFGSHALGKAYVFVRQLYPSRVAGRALYAARFHAAEKTFDLFHAANFFPPARLRKPFLPVIHDLSCLRFPEMHPRERVNWFARGLKQLSDVPFVQTVSEFSKSEIVTLLNISPDRVHVIYQAPGEEFRPDGATDEVCLAKYNAERYGYFLVVGTQEPRKNFKTVAEAHTALPVAIRNHFPLLWVGASGWGDLELSPAVERAKETGQIRLTGYIPDRDLAALYRNTVLFMMPSIYEGFGMPIIEALACGAPVAVSKIPVFEEIAARHARYVGPMDIEGWRQAMEEGLAAERRSSGTLDSRRDLARFSWDRSATMTLDLWHRLAEASLHLNRAATGGSSHAGY